MKLPVVIIGPGEIGSVLARGFLRKGHPVYPVVRGTEPAQAIHEFPDPELVVLAVSEKDLHTSLATIPDAWKSRTVLLQNELLPDDWLQQGFQFPTVISVWFEKKKGQDVKVLLPSPAYGQYAGHLQAALATLDIPVKLLTSEDELLNELVLKNVYILTTNIAGLKTGGSVGELWSEHREFASLIAGEVIQLQEMLTGKTLDTDTLISGMVEAFNGDLEHKCMGRSAPARLARALQLADSFNLDLTQLKDIAAKQD